jgi:hypothetical protein
VAEGTSVGAWVGTTVTITVSTTFSTTVSTMTTAVWVGSGGACVAVGCSPEGVGAGAPHATRVRARKMMTMRFIVFSFSVFKIL